MHRLIGLPEAVGLLVMGLAASVILLLVERIVPQIHLYDRVGAILQQVDFLGHEASAPRRPRLRRRRLGRHGRSRACLKRDDQRAGTVPSGLHILGSTRSDL